jgi:hypothetical protein
MELNADNNNSDWLKEHNITEPQPKSTKIYPFPCGVKCCNTPNKIYPFPCDFKCCDTPNKISLSKNNMIQKCLNCETLISSGG